MKTKAQKQAEVAKLTEILREAKGAVLVDFTGITVAEDTELRVKMRDAKVTYGVYKNTLIARAAKEVGIEGLDEILNHNTALAASADDAVVAAKVISEYAKTNKKLLVKAGVLEGKVIGEEEVKALANLPSKEVLLAKMLGSMQAPITGLVQVLNGTIRKTVYVLDAIREQKEKQSA